MIFRLLQAKTCCFTLEKYGELICQIIYLRGKLAILENYETKEKILLRSHHVFGRESTNSNTLLKNRDASRVHASIRWDESLWKILDHSRNGTWIDGKRMAIQQSVPLKVGNIIQFGGAKASAWKVMDLEKPRPALFPLETNQPIILLESFQALPSDQSHEISLYRSHEEQWMSESEEGVVVLREGDLVSAGGMAWRFLNASVSEATKQEIAGNAFDKESPHFSFQVSRNEEHVSVKLFHSGETFDLGERTHHYLLLTLARQRLKDAQEGCDLHDQGWIEFHQLSRLLGLDYSYLNNQVFRIRKQVAGALQKSRSLPSQVIERRVGELRFGFSKLKIFRGSTLEGQIP